VTVSKEKDGRWLVEINRKGLKRVRRRFATELEANRFESDYVAPHIKAVERDGRTLKQVVALWFKYHGVNLSDGVRRRRCLDAVAAALGNGVAVELSAEAFVDYRYARLEAGLSPKTFNNHHGYFSSMFERLIKLKVIDYSNPLDGIDFVKIHERQLSYLSGGQIEALMGSINNGCVNESTWYVAQLCLRTGARWGEVEQLCFKQLRDGRVTYEFTKSKRTRSIPLDAVFYAQLLEFARGKSPNDRVFTNCIGAFRRAVMRAGLSLPTGQCSHILRHSFASHFMMNGGNILSLQKILGHADISMTMRYAHLAPDHLLDAIRLNPLAVITANDSHSQPR